MGTASVVIANVGSRAAAEVVQLYVNDNATVGRPEQELKAFSKVHL